MLVRGGFPCFPAPYKETLACAWGKLGYLSLPYRVLEHAGNCLAMFVTVASGVKVAGPGCIPSHCFVD